MRGLSVVKEFPFMRSALSGSTRLLPALLLPVLLAACGSPGNYVGSPFAGFGGFIGDTHRLRNNPNGAIGDSDNMRRVRGEEVASPPLLPEPGNIWPGPITPEPTLQDIEREQNQNPNLAPEAPTAPTAPAVPHPQPRPPGSSTPPEPVVPSPVRPPPALQSTPSPEIPAPPSVPSGSVVQTPQGPATITNNANGTQTFILPGGATGRAINNGNGTMTLIHPDGSVQSVPVPR
jgi:hypothetical protein